MYNAARLSGNGENIAIVLTQLSKTGRQCIYAASL
jgi:hypothetical protein